jgi:hypothetical protein
MGDHSAENGPLKQMALDAGAYAWRNRRRIAAGVLVALPLLSRYFPGFPVDDVVKVVRLFLGA